MRTTMVLAAVALLTIDTASAGSQELPRLDTNEAYVGQVTRTSTLAIADPLAVFDFVLSSLPERVKVYPTENYYYFRFIHNGTPYAGNIRLNESDRDQGKVHFDYYADGTDWTKDAPETHYIFDAAQGIVVTKLDRFAYGVSHGGKSVVFALNDLSDVKPPATAIGPDEIFLGPIFDELGTRFFFIFNSRLKVFHFILDETVKVPDELFPAARGDSILIGRRTGFAFYRDGRLDRKILIGAFEGNSRLNNYFDGPFDQLPENFIEGDALRAAILAADPSVKGQIDRLGRMLDGSGRYLIHPYLLYKKPADLQVFKRCANDRRVASANYYACFVIDDQEQGKASPRPLALKQRSRAVR